MFIYETLHCFSSTRVSSTHVMKNIRHTLLLITGESSANHVSCLSVWQCAKQELTNNPFCLDVENPFSAFSIWFLKPAKGINSMDTLVNR